MATAAVSNLVGDDGIQFAWTEHFGGTSAQHHAPAVAR